MRFACRGALRTLGLTTLGLGGSWLLLPSLFLWCRGLLGAGLRAWSRAGLRTWSRCRGDVRWLRSRRLRAYTGGIEADELALLIPTEALDAISVTCDDLPSVVEVDIGEGIHPTPREDRRSEDTPLA